jgi:CRISPR system Cascade subunit CasC
VDSGSAHIGETAFAAGLFYLYVCVDCDLLVGNLNGDKNLAKKTLKALTEATTKVAPTGKQNSFASRAYAIYVLAEKGKHQPRSLSAAFLKAVAGTDYAEEAIQKLKGTRDMMDQVYGLIAEKNYEMDAVHGKGSLKELLDFAADC